MSSGRIWGRLLASITTAFVAPTAMPWRSRTSYFCPSAMQNHGRMPSLVAVSTVSRVMQHHYRLAGSFAIAHSTSPLNSLQSGHLLLGSRC